MSAPVLVLMALLSGGGGGGPGAPQDTAVPALPLREVVESALATHPRLAGAVAGLGAEEAEAGQARSSLWPSLAVAGVATRYQEPMVVAPLHGFDLQRPPAFDQTLYQAHASLEYTVFDGGGRLARIRAAESRWAAAGRGVVAAREAVVAEAVSSYLAALTARDLRAAHAHQVAALESELGRARQFLEEGTASRVEVLRTESMLAEARAGLESADQQLHLSLTRLSRVSGLSGDRVTAGALVEVGPVSPEPPDRDELVARAAESSPRLAGVRDRVAAAEAGVRAARGGYLPRVALTGRYSAFDSPSTDAALEWQAGVQLSYPVFTGGARAREVDRARAGAAAARTESELAWREVVDAVDAALAAYRSARARIEALETAVASAAEVTRIEALALSAGAGVQTDYLQAEAALLRARAGLAETRHAAVEARVRLAQATGGLDLEWLGRLMEGVDR